jgi:transcriptional regulator with GAF, ATPase, and Fis domain
MNPDSSTSLIVAGPAMQAIVEKMRLVARSKDTTVMITGESGTGKELIARGIHYMSRFPKRQTFPCGELLYHPRRAF